ncbi:MAG TPA: DUF5666 domain-containing protein [Anaerolineales bacterium]|nr:DUF5666 domain-containing protein [Anaerolineales bacterium]
MNRKMNSNQRRVFLFGSLGTLIFILGCMTVMGGSPDTGQATLQLDGNVVQVRDQDGGWSPVAGASTFELVGSVESTEPWKVSGRTLETNQTTRVGQGVQTGDLVLVRGAALDQNDWLAYSIEPAQEQTDPVVTLIGTVDSVDPWVVNGITLNVTEDTVAEGDITPGMLVRVEILLLEDGTWEVIRIVPLGDLTDTSGCANVIATVVSVNGDQIQFLGWPTTVTFADDDNDASENEDGDDRVVEPGQKVLAVVCVVNKQVVIVQVTVLDDNDGDDGEPAANGEKVLICHKPDKKGGHTLSIASAAVPAHLGHGDRLGACP